MSQWIIYASAVAALLLFFFGPSLRVSPQVWEHESATPGKRLRFARSRGRGGYWRWERVARILPGLWIITSHAPMLLDGEGFTAVWGGRPCPHSPGKPR